MMWARKQTGFTIVELLIVVVVIAILAAIVIVSYNGVRNQAIVSGMKSDLQSTVTELGISQASNGVYPNSLTNRSSNFGQYTYATNGSSICVSITSTSAGVGSYYFSTSKGTIQSGTCQVTVSALAGNGTSGTTDAIGTSARFGSLRRMAVGVDGNIFVVDTGNNRIRKITPDGTVTTVAGSTSGYTNATGTSAQFRNPTGIDIDGAGNLYVADTGNYAIRKISPTGVVTTLAGTGSIGASDGTGTSASFRSVNDVAIDSAGNVFVADAHVIRKITPAGAVTLFAGQWFNYGSTDGSGTNARFRDFIQGITIDSNDNLYVADAGNYKIRKITSSGDVSTVAGSGTSGFEDGAGGAVQFGAISGITSDASGNLYVADETNNRIRVVSMGGVVTTYAGTGVSGSTDGVGNVATFANPVGIAVDRATGVVYVAQSAYLVRKIVPQF